MKTWIIDTPIETASGTQRWRAQAETQEEALAIYHRGGADFIAEEIEVYRVGEPVITEEKE